MEVNDFMVRALKTAKEITSHRLRLMCSSFDTVTCDLSLVNEYYPHGLRFSLSRIKLSGSLVDGGCNQSSVRPVIGKV
jgi:hypothetical protein